MLRRILFISRDRKKWKRTGKGRKNMAKAEKEKNTDESDFSKTEVLDWNSLKPFEFESKTNIRVISSSSSGDQKQPLVVVP